MAKKGSYIAWSDLLYGGTVEDRPRQNGQMMKVVTDRKIVKRGESVTQTQLGVDDAIWEALINSGSVRPYDLPEGSDDYTSPATAMMRSLVDDKGEIDINKLMELGVVTAPPVTNPPADEAQPVGV